MDLGMRDRVALVTGAGQGIGEAIALTLAAEGVKLAVNDINAEAAQRTAEKVRALGIQADTFITDVADLEAARKMVADIDARFGRLDILVNNAGVSILCPFEELTPEIWHKTMAVNLTGAFFCALAVFPLMKRQHYGRIVSISSYAAKRGSVFGGSVPYCASKAGILGLTVSLAPEAAQYGITVNAVAPGFIFTDMLRAHPQERLDRMTDMLWIKRLGTAEDVARTVVYLASDAAAYITGEVVDVNGGLLMDH